MPFWPRPATTSGSLWPGSGLCAPFSGRLSWSGMTRAAPPPHPPERPNSLFHRRRAAGHLAEVPDGVGERPRRAAVPVHGGDEPVEAALDKAGVFLAPVVQDVRGPVHPAVGARDVRP